MTVLRTITNFKTALAGGGARANLFEVAIPTFPGAVANSDWNVAGGDFRFLCKAAQLPFSNVAPIDVPFRGRILKIAGDRTFDTWTVTVINDEDFRIRTAFEQWMNAISKLDNNTGATNPTSYMSNAFVYQLGRGANRSRESAGNSAITGGTPITPLRTYKFYDIFPTNVAAIDLSYDSSDAIEEFTVEFQVQYWTAGEGTPDQTGTIIS